MLDKYLKVVIMAFASIPLVVDFISMPEKVVTYREGLLLSVYTIAWLYCLIIQYLENHNNSKSNSPKE